MMDGRKGEYEPEGGEWELLHHQNDVEEEDPLVFHGPPLGSLRPDHFSLNPPIHNPNSSTCSSNSSSELDRNFDDSYVANHLFPSPNPDHPLWNDSDSDASTAVLAPEPQSHLVPLDSGKEEEEEEPKKIVWWKVPFEVLKHWLNPLPLPLPLWSLSVAAAAAFLGLMLLGRKLYRMKRKTQSSFNLNLALDDKKVSQLMGRVARLNEAFSVVRRVPIVRPSLPASSVTLRPVMSMR
ncbi:uncharacterized protein LOC113848443 [Abrus precatorius]|uniref:Uncharacterized protein LOC113848443 n=1 Tax=Abrus precatorius TaxID=3816 RepID=A0A8B8JQF7_ABRPR|nr:uncharacterized protein LOC113848443 [Abrus precatorius]